VFRTAPDHPTRQRAVILLLLNAGVAWATRNHRCRSMAELIDLTVDWLDERRFFRVTRKMYQPPQKAQDFR
jgi:hypothetical protein